MILYHNLDLVPPVRKSSEKEQHLYVDEIPLLAVIEGKLVFLGSQALVVVEECLYLGL